MAWDVHIHVCFPCNNNDGVAKLAAKHLEQIKEQHGSADWWDKAEVSSWFLADLAKRSGPNPGRKGGLSLWGMVGNYTDVEGFCETLKPFWSDLLSEINGGPLDFERVIVFEEEEQSEAATAYEIMWDDYESETRQIIIKAHKRLPFSWGQA